RLRFRAGFGGRGKRTVDGAEAAPEAEDVAEIVEVAFAIPVEEAAKILEGINDVPLGEREVGVVELAPVTLLIDGGKGGYGRCRGSGIYGGAARPFDVGERQDNGEHEKDHGRLEETAQESKHGRQCACAALADSRSGWRRRRARDAGHWRRTASRATG